MNTTFRVLLPIVCVGALAGAALFAANYESSVRPVAPLLVGAGDIEARPALQFVLGRIASELELTEAQRASAQEVIRTHYADLRAAFEKGREARENMTRVVRSSSPSEADFAAAADRVSAAARELALATGHLRADLRLVLDDAQKAKLEELHGRLQKRLGSLREALAEEFGSV